MDGDKAAELSFVVDAVSEPASPDSSQVSGAGQQRETSPPGEPEAPPPQNNRDETWKKVSVLRGEVSKLEDPGAVLVLNDFVSPLIEAHPPDAPGPPRAQTVDGGSGQGAPSAAADTNGLEDEDVCLAPGGPAHPIESNAPDASEQESAQLPDGKSKEDPENTTHSDITGSELSFVVDDVCEPLDFDDDQIGNETAQTTDPFPSGLEQNERPSTEQGGGASALFQSAYEHPVETKQEFEVGSSQSSWFSVETKSDKPDGAAECFPTSMVTLKVLLAVVEKIPLPNTADQPDPKNTTSVFPKAEEGPDKRNDKKAPAITPLPGAAPKEFEFQLSIDLGSGEFLSFEAFKGIVGKQLKQREPSKLNISACCSRTDASATRPLDGHLWAELLCRCGLEESNSITKNVILWLQVEGDLPALPPRATPSDGAHSPLLLEHVDSQSSGMSSENRAFEDPKPEDEVKQKEDVESGTGKLDQTEGQAPKSPELIETSSSPRLPMIGAVVLAVNGVRTAGVGYEAVKSLLDQRTRPLTVDLTDSWNSILDGISNRDRLTRRTIEKKMEHRAARDVKKKIDEFLGDFKNSNLGELMMGPAEREPNKMVWSLIYWANQELVGLGLFDNRQYGGGLPAMGEKQFKDVLEHLERIIFERIFSACLRSCPGYIKQDNKLRDKMASLRFLKPQYFGADVQYPLGPEWELAQEELCKILNCKSPIDMLGCVRASVRMVALSVEASRSRKGKKGAIGADDILPALTWIVVQANPPELHSRLWFMSYYMSTEAGMTEAGYCLTQLSSVIDLVQSIRDASLLTGISTDEFNAGVGGQSLIQEGLYAVKAGEKFRLVALLKAGARYDQLGSGNQHTILTAAVVSGNNDMVEEILKYHRASKDKSPEKRSSGPRGPFRSFSTVVGGEGNLDVRVSPHFGENSGKTALHFAAQSGNLRAVLALLREGADRKLTDRQGFQPVDIAAEGKQQAAEPSAKQKYQAVVDVLLADPKELLLSEVARRGEMSRVRALLLQGADPNCADKTDEYTPLIVASYNGWLPLVELLLGTSADLEAGVSTTLIRADANVTNRRGETALMYAVQGSGATVQSQIQVAVALLKAGADRYMKDEQGQAAFDWAAKFGSEELQRILQYDPAKDMIYRIARAKDQHGVEALLAQGVDPNARCPKGGYTALLASVYNGDVPLTQRLLAHAKIDIDAADEAGMSPLMWAAKNGDEEMVLLLLEHRAERWQRLSHNHLSASDLAHQEGFDELALIIQHNPLKESICVVAWENDWLAVRSLVKQGVSINARHKVHTKKGWHHEQYTPLIAACARGHVDLVKQMLTLPGIDVNLPNLLGQTPLMYSAALGSEELVLLLLKVGANRYLRDMEKKAALDWCQDRQGPLSKVLKVDPAKRSIQVAAANGKTQEVQALIKQGVSANDTKELNLREILEKQRSSSLTERRKTSKKPSNQPEEKEEELFAPPEVVLKESVDATPLMLACCFNHEETTRFLLQRPEVQVDFRDAEGRTALMHAARCGSEACVLLLLDRAVGRCRRRLRDRRKKTATDYALLAGHLGIAGIIEVDPDRVPICYVAAAGRVVLVEALLKQGAAVNTVDPDQPQKYQTPLIAAARAKRLPMVRFLLNRPDIKVNQVNSAGETALMHAVAVGALEVAQVLMAHGASPRKRDPKGLTAEHWAFKKGYVNMLKFKLTLSCKPPPT